MYFGSSLNFERKQLHFLHPAVDRTKASATGVMITWNPSFKTALKMKPKRSYKKQMVSHQDGLFSRCPTVVTPQWGAVGAEIEVPSGENTELKTEQVIIQPYMLRLLPGISSLLISTLPVYSRAFFQKTLPFSLVLAVANTWLLCRPAE